MYLCENLSSNALKTHDETSGPARGQKQPILSRCAQARRGCISSLFARGCGNSVIMILRIERTAGFELSERMLVCYGERRNNYAKLLLVQSFRL